MKNIYNFIYSFLVAWIIALTFTSYLNKSHIMKALHSNLFKVTVRGVLGTYTLIYNDSYPDMHTVYELLYSGDKVVSEIKKAKKSDISGAIPFKDSPYVTAYRIYQ